MASSVECVQASLARISEIDELTCSVVTVAEDALVQAQRRDAERASGLVRSPLHGMPVVLKDNIDTVDLPTTAGSLALAQDRPAQDAPLVARLREAGMVILGKANLSEWANIRSPQSISGWSAVGGLTRNPYALDRSACGSSSGSAAAVAAGIVDLAVGTETDGSITHPAAFCGVVGLKPTVGLVPTEGVVPISWSQDAPGPMTRTVSQCAALLDVLTGSHPTQGYAAQCADLGTAAAALNGLRLGLPRQYWGDLPSADPAARAAVDRMVAAGAQVVDADLSRPSEQVHEAELLVILSELREGVERYLSSRPRAGVSSLAQVVEFNRRHGDREMVHFGQEFFEAALEGPTTESADYVQARALVLEWGRDGIERAARDCDVLVAPTTGRAVHIDHDGNEEYEPAAYGAAAVAGFPVISVPTEVVDGLPVALAFFAGAEQESLLLRVASAHEALRDAALGPFPRPTFVDSLDRGLLRLARRAARACRARRP